MLWNPSGFRIGQESPSEEAFMSKNEPKQPPKNPAGRKGKPVKLPDNFDEVIDKLTGGPVRPAQGSVPPPKPGKRE